MRFLNTCKVIPIPAGVTVEVEGPIVRVHGPLGDSVRDFSKHHILIACDGDQVTCQLWFSRKKRSSVVSAVASHIRNMITGVRKGFRYRMRTVFAHFPINLTVGRNKTRLEIRKFMGEKYIRYIDMEPGVECEVSGKDELVVEGVDVDAVSRSATAVHTQTLVRNKDIRKFLDGVYVSDKGNMVE